MIESKQNKSGKIVLFIFLAIAACLGVAAFVMTFTNKCHKQEGFERNVCGYTVKPEDHQECWKEQGCGSYCFDTNKYKCCSVNGYYGITEKDSCGGDCNITCDAAKKIADQTNHESNYGCPGDSNFDYTYC